MVIGLLCAAVAALAYGTASVLQSIGVRRAGLGVQRDGHLTGLARQPVYFIGLALDGIGFVVAVIAMQFLPLFLVQTVVTASVGVTALISAATGTRLKRSGWLALGITGMGLSMLAVSAASEKGQQLPIGWRWVLLALVAPIGIVALIGPKLVQRNRAPMLAIGAGLGFTIVAIASRSLALPSAIWRLLLDPAFWAIIAAGIIGIVLFALALQAGPVTTVSAVTFTTEAAIPAAVGVFFLGDAVRNGFWPVAIAGFMLAVVGAITLAKFAQDAPANHHATPANSGAGAYHNPTAQS